LFFFSTCPQNPHLVPSINVELGDNLPGKDGDRKSARGLLNWIFTAIADTIAWSTIPSSLFQKLFRQDLLVASLFRNFLLAQRIMRSFNCTPQSYPLLPDCSTHPLWQAWDAAVEHCLLFVNKMNSEVLLPAANGPMINHRTQPNHSTAGPTIQSLFFNEQLIAFEIWLDFGGPGGSYKHCKESPVYLPILLQVSSTIFIYHLTASFRLYSRMLTDSKVFICYGDMSPLVLSLFTRS
jgi:regulatory associated protein of mTOR